MLFPDSLAYEQSSHEAVAMFHSPLAGSSHSVLDMTAGTGIDAMAFANKCASVTACEINATKADVLAHNSQASGLDNFTVLNADSVEWLKSNDTRFNTIFIDPLVETATTEECITSGTAYRMSPLFKTFLPVDATLCLLRLLPFSTYPPH